MTKETVPIRTESALEGDEFRLNRCQPILRLRQFLSPRNGRLYIYLVYILIWVKAVSFIDEKDIAEAGCFLWSKAGLTATPRKGHGDLPVFFDELNDALKAHDAEKYSSTPARCERARQPR
jgi:hypothetical protein